MSWVLSVDGTPHELGEDAASDTLLAALRERVGCTAVKEGCLQGRCGTCSVLLDGTLATSCTVLAADAEGREVTTAAGLGTPDAPSRVQQALVEAGAVQCGFCTPGMAVAITALLAADPHPSDTAVREALSGNLCRCTGYARIIAAVHALAAEDA
ncbi:carbon-monoxide dehydrogenase small subunit [Motilibacter rhizosphaerae]|uniref:Carbon-monoxide dehydrogenase small subunit n=1 Tax=Motilibacter rhizosphaerae TaxID=598652 RepID=A0A4Q7NWJ4_9ACTN|nr:(2Fe-2S)-binding protein [Motilibacter rhizosphaerae]RZS91683.1 carbon-monoxide dehydrogenase small subunit [Motilibacter rhizosphaerae]